MRGHRDLRQAAALTLLCGLIASLLPVEAAQPALRCCRSPSSCPATRSRPRSSPAADSNGHGCLLLSIGLSLAVAGARAVAAQLRAGRHRARLLDAAAGRSSSSTAAAPRRCADRTTAPGGALAPPPPQRPSRQPSSSARCSAPRPPGPHLHTAAGEERQSATRSCGSCRPAPHDEASSGRAGGHHQPGAEGDRLPTAGQVRRERGELVRRFSLEPGRRTCSARPPSPPRPARGRYRLRRRSSARADRTVVPPRLGWLAARGGIAMSGKGADARGRRRGQQLQLRPLPPRRRSRARSRQTHADVAVIVVDDGSTDDSREILRGYEDGRRGRAEGERRPGLGAQRRHGAQSRRRGDLPRRRRRPSPPGRRAGRGRLRRRPRPGQGAVPDGGDRRRGAADRGAEATPCTCRCRAATCASAELAFPFDLVWLPTSANAFRAEALREILPIPEAAFPVSAPTGIWST